jgi:serine/threonine protein kinase
MVIEVRDAAGRPRQIGPELARGGQAIVYRVPGSPPMLAKLYPAAMTNDTRAKLEWIIAHHPSLTGVVSGHVPVAWPAELLWDTAGRPVGFLMPQAVDAVPILKASNPRTRRRELPNFDLRYLYRIARNLSAAVRAVHENGYVIGDLNESNILITRRALVTVIDADSFQVTANGRVFHCPVGKIEFTAPELQGASFENVIRTTAHDHFALAVMLFQLAMNGNHPFRSRWTGTTDPPSLGEKIALGCFPYAPGGRHPVLPPPEHPSLSVLHPHLAALFQRAFVAGHRSPAQRPSAQEWAEAFATAEAGLVSCPQKHWYPGHLPRCPVCDHPATGTDSMTGSIARPTPPLEPPPVAPPPAPGQGRRASPVLNRRSFLWLGAASAAGYALWSQRPSGTPDPPNPGTRAGGPYIASNGILILSDPMAYQDRDSVVDPVVELSDDEGNIRLAISEPGYGYSMYWETPTTPLSFAATMRLIPRGSTAGTYDLYFNRSSSGRSFYAVRVAPNGDWSYERSTSQSPEIRTIAAGTIDLGDTTRGVAITVSRTTDQLALAAGDGRPVLLDSSPARSEAGIFAIGLTKSATTTSTRAFGATFTQFDVYEL